MPLGSSRFTPRWLQEELEPERLLPALTSGILLGATEVLFAISLASLIFSGELGPFLARGIGIALFTAATMFIITSLTSRVPGVMGSVQDTSSVILAVIAAGLVGALPRVSQEDMLATVWLVIAAATLLTGVFFFALGTLKLGALVRYIPYPVVGGFLAGTGWLLVQGAFSVMTGFPLNLANFSSLLQPGQVIFWLPGVIVAAVLFFGLRRFKHALILPGILLGAVAVFYLSLWVMGISIEEAIQSGLLLGRLTAGAAWQPLLPGDLQAIQWEAVLAQSGNIAIILVLSLVGLLLNATALELAIRQDVDLNRELRAAGIANFLSGLGGGIVGYHALSLSTLSYRMGARGRLPGLIAGAVCLVILFAGTALLAFFPKLVLGGLLIFVGLDFLAEWLVAGWKKLSRVDYAVVWAILLIIVAAGFLTGVAVGLVAMILLFVWNYSRIDVVYHALSGAEMRSNVERCVYHQQALADRGGGIYILELQGFIFFGTSNKLLERIRSRILDIRQPKVRYILLDFRRVSGLDSSAALSFAKGRQLAEAQGIVLVMTYISAANRQKLELGGVSDQDKRIHFFPDLDRGLEWCEEQILELEQITGLHTPVKLVAQLVDGGLKKDDSKRLIEFLERVTFQEGDYLIRQGIEADSLYFIELGCVSVYLEIESGERVRLQTFGLGTAVGEMDLYQGCISTAAVIAEAPVVAYRLTRAALEAMKARDPQLAATFHEFIAHLLSERLAATTRTLKAVIR